MEKKIGDFARISTERIRKSTAKKAEKIGQVRLVDKKNPDKTVIVKPEKVKDVILKEAKSGESINHFKERLRDGLEVGEDEYEVKGRQKDVKAREAFVDYIKELLGEVKETAKKVVRRVFSRRDYYKIKAEEIRRQEEELNK